MSYNGVALIESHWYGVSLGGEHYYGEVWYEGERHDITHRLTQAEATYLNKKEEAAGHVRCFRYSKGEISERFEDEKSLCRAGLKMARDMGARVVLHGCYAIADPQKCLWAQERGIKGCMNKLWRAFEKMDGYNAPRDKRPKLDSISNEWEHILKQAAFKPHREQQ